MDNDSFLKIIIVMVSLKFDEHFRKRDSEDKGSSSMTKPRIGYNY